jgi:hypothetical protein
LSSTRWSGSCRTASPPDICALAVIYIVFGEADPPSANCRAAQIKNLLYFRRERVRELSSLSLSHIHRHHRNPLQCQS